MVIETIPTKAIVSISALLSMYIAYEARIDRIDSRRERERALNEQLNGKTIYNDKVQIRFDNISVSEDDGFRYRAKKFLGGEFSGTSDATIRYTGAAIAEEFWNAQGGEHFLNECPMEIVHITTDEYVSPISARFQIDSTDRKDILDIFDNLLDYEEESRD